MLLTYGVTLRLADSNIPIDAGYRPRQPGSTIYWPRARKTASDISRTTSTTFPHYRSIINNTPKMPSTIIRGARNPDKPSAKPTATFTGDVWMDPIHQAPNITMVHVMFQPCARTHWHTHENGQMLRVLAGSGWVCDKGGEPRRLNVGDMVWADPGTTHWHGGGDDSFMLHLAVSHGKTTWHDAVTEDEFRAKNSEK